MGKLQAVTRKNNSTVHFMTIPKDLVDEMELKKGVDLFCEKINKDCFRVVRQ